MTIVFFGGVVVELFMFGFCVYLAKAALEETTEISQRVNRFEKHWQEIVLENKGTPKKEKSNRVLVEDTVKVWHEGGVSYIRLCDAALLPHTGTRVHVTIEEINQ